MLRVSGVSAKPRFSGELWVRNGDLDKLPAAVTSAPKAGENGKKQATGFDLSREGKDDAANEAAISLGLVAQNIPFAWSSLRDDRYEKGKPTRASDRKVTPQNTIVDIRRFFELGRSFHFDPGGVAERAEKKD